MGVDADVILFNDRVYGTRVLPPYREFLASGKLQPLIDLVAELARSLPSDPTGASMASREYFDEYGEILSGRQFYSSAAEVDDGTKKTTREDLVVLVKGQVGPRLFQALCPVRDGRAGPEQSMSRTSLPLYLYSKSRWIEDYFTFAKEPAGEVLEIVVGEWCRCFASSEVKRFDEELQRIPRPRPAEASADEFLKLRKIVRRALIEPDLKLLLAVG